MSVTIKEVSGIKELRTFIDFPETLYKTCEYFVPQIFFDQVNTLSVHKNPASEFCESALYLAYKDGVLAGRVAAIVNRKANEQWNHKEVRFGWLDFVDDAEVSEALIRKVEEFGRQRGMDSIVGPLGFTDFDPEGMLVEGFDSPSTMVLNYNYPYYPVHMDALGFGKDVDWLEFRCKVPDELPERISRISNLIEERTGVHKANLGRRDFAKPEFCHELFHLINECYKNLYDFTILPDSMAEKYLGFYIKVVDPEFVSILKNDKGEIVAFGITMPSLAKVLQKNRGKLFPFGWIPLLWNLFVKHGEGVEMLLVGVRPDYQNTGINSLLFSDLLGKFIQKGIKWTETNAILETNLKNQGQFRDYGHILERRRRAYKKQL